MKPAVAVIAALLGLGLAPAAAEPATQPARELTLYLGGNVQLKLVLIPAGKFLMGSSEAERSRQADEGPQREVTITGPFYMGIYEITQEQYEAVMGQSPSFFRGRKNPVETVSWDEVAQFCQKLSQKAGKAVRLPTEAQWEYACRAGSNTRFSFGDDPEGAKLREHAWFEPNGHRESHRVGGMQANAFGLYDMHGNVAEWCSDWYANSYPAGAATDPQGPAEGQYRVLRGGSWTSSAPFCRCAYRGWSAPGNRNGDIGFRITMDVSAGDSPLAQMPDPKLSPPAAANSIGMRFVEIAPGEFQMGSSLSADELANRLGGDAQWYAPEFAQHKAQIRDRFMLGMHEVTVGQFAAFVKASGYQTEAEKEGGASAWDGAQWTTINGASWRNPGFEQTEQHPVVCVSWSDTQAFCAWLSRKEGRSYRLPTEAEWEYACRAGGQTLFAWGDKPEDGKGWANCADASARQKFPDWTASFAWEDGFVYTSPVGSFKANGLGLYDMIGNAGEWCGDWYAYPTGAGQDPAEPPNDLRRILRGGSWHDNMRFCRDTYRFWKEPEYRAYHVGFRVVLESP